MKDLLPVALLVALALVGYDDWRTREQLTEAKARIDKLETQLTRVENAGPNASHPPTQSPIPPQNNWLQQRLQQPNPLNQPPTQSGGGGGGQGRGGGPGGGGSGGGGGGRGGPPR